MNTRLSQNRKISQACHLIFLLLCNSMFVVLISIGGCVQELKDQSQSSKTKTQALSVGKEQKEKEIKAAIAKIDQELLAPQEPVEELYEARANLFMQIGNYEKAYEDFSTAMELCFKTGNSTRSLAIQRLPAAIQAGFHQQALKDLEGLIRADLRRDEAGLYAIIALLHAKSPLPTIRDPQKSLDYAKLAEEINSPPDSVVTKRALAAAYSVNGDFKKAREYQTKAADEELRSNGRVPDSMNKELDAYKNNKEFPYEIGNKLGSRT